MSYRAQTKISYDHTPGRGDRAEAKNLLLEDPALCLRDRVGASNHRENVCGASKGPHELNVNFRKTTTGEGKNVG